MGSVLFLKLGAIFTTIALGVLAGRFPAFRGGEAARILSNAAFYLFAPALLFRATARIDLAALPWRALAVFFGPVVLGMVGVYLLQKRALRRASGAQGTAPEAAAPAVRAITAAFGNNAQLGIPLAAALFGEAGLQIHLAVVSLHALVLLSLLTVLVERDLAQAAVQRGEAPASLAGTLARVVRNTVIHPIVLPVLAGMAWNLGGLPLPGPLDEVLLMLGTAVVPLCLVAIGLSLGHYGVRGAARVAGQLSAFKLLVQPALVLAAGWAVDRGLGGGLLGLPLTVIVLAAANPTGSNALMFAQRYRSQEAEATATIVVSTAAFVLTAPLWLLLLGALGGPLTP